MAINDLGAADREPHKVECCSLDFRPEASTYRSVSGRPVAPAEKSSGKAILFCFIAEPVACGGQFHYHPSCQRQWKVYASIQTPGSRTTNCCNIWKGESTLSVVFAHSLHPLNPACSLRIWCPYARISKQSERLRTNHHRGYQSIRYSLSTGS